MESVNDRGPCYYQDYEIQPWDFIIKNQIGYAEGNVIKYICRWRDKGGVKDLVKAVDYIAKILETNQCDVTVQVTWSEDGKEKR